VTKGAREQSRGVDGTSRRAAAWMAWSLCALSLTLTVLSLLLFALNRSHSAAYIYDYVPEPTVMAVGCSVFGAIIVSRLPTNPLAWLFCAMALVSAASHFGAEYAIYTLLAQPDSLPAGQAVAWTASWVWVLFLGSTLLLLLLFPTGRLPNRRWRPLAWTTVAVILMAMISSALSPETALGSFAFRNPLGIEGMSILYDVVWSFMIPAVFVAAALSLFVRLHRAMGVERQQLKWFAYAAAAVAIGPIFAYQIPEAVDVPLWFRWAGLALLLAGTAGLPISMGIAILRYRLYEIDTLINGTLVYGALTVLLAVVYFGGVKATQAIFRTLTGHEQQPQLAVVVSTLVIAALFNPLRHRIQAFTDRRFYRRKCDAAKTLEAFSAKLRDETDLDALRDDLVGVVRETMQPAHVSLWLRPGTSLKGHAGDGGKPLTP
jgi:hypothetical protein